MTETETETEKVYSFSSVTVGVSNLDDALALWVDRFGLETIAHQPGPDIELASLWGISPSDVARQALIRTPGQSHGMVHFVEFVDPDPPVRVSADAYDSCPKNLDLYVEDMPEQVKILRSFGYSFRSENFSESTAPDGLQVREIQLSADDGLNIVLLQVLDKKMSFSANGYRGIGPIVTAVADVDKERHFYQSILGLELLSENLLEGPVLEEIVGLPAGATLSYNILGHRSMDLGRVELVSYKGITGTDLFDRARPKALGILHITYEFDELESLLSRLESAQVPHNRHGTITTLAASGDTISFSSPAGLRIEAVKRNGAAHK